MGQYSQASILRYSIVRILFKDTTGPADAGRGLESGMAGRQMETSLLGIRGAYGAARVYRAHSRPCTVWRNL